MKIKELLINSKFFRKLKSIKHIEYIILIIFIGILALVFIGSWSGEKTAAETTYKDYAQVLEVKLKNVLSQLDGVGNLEVMVTVNSSPELIIATSKEERINNNSSGSSNSENTTVVETPIIITQNGVSTPLILQEIMPEIKGVIVVAEGADDVKVRLELLKAVQSVLKIQISCIEIFVGK